MSATRRTNARKSVLAALALVLLAACQTPVEAPVGLEPGDAAFDPRLPGAWYGGDGEGFAVTLLVAARAESQVLDVILAWSDGPSRATANGDPDPEHFAVIQAVVRPVALDGATYYEARRDADVGYDYTPAGMAPGVILLRPAFTPDGELVLEGLSGKVVAAEGAAYGVALVATSIGGEDTYRHLAASRESLVAMIRGVGPDRLFVERWGPLSKVGKITTPLTVEGIEP
ncbi:MAG: hypothetical protein ACREER_08625 [Alphaproteobacteria bacterium]